MDVYSYSKLYHRGGNISFHHFHCYKLIRKMIPMLIEIVLHGPWVLLHFFFFFLVLPKNSKTPSSLPGPFLRVVFVVKKTLRSEVMCPPGKISGLLLVLKVIESLNLVVLPTVIQHTTWAGTSWSPPVSSSWNLITWRKNTNQQEAHGIYWAKSNKLSFVCDSGLLCPMAESMKQ